MGLALAHMLLVFWLILLLFCETST